MLRTIVEISLKYRFLVVAIAGALVGLALMRAWTTPIDTFPEFAPPMVEVQTEAPGLAAAEVERLVTLPIEELLSGVSWLKTLRSETVAGLSSVRLLFEPGTDLMRARQLVQERLTLSYTIPTTAKVPVMLQPLSSTSRVMMIGLSSKELSLIQQSVIAQWTIKPKLLGVPGVANVAIWGERRRQLQVQVDPESLRGIGVKQEQIVSTAGDSLYVASLSFLKASNPGSGGWIDGPNQRLEIRHVLPMSSADDLGKVSVDGSKKVLSEVSTVVEGHPPMVGEAIVDGKPGLILVVEKFPGASTVDVARRVKAAISAMRAGLPGLTIDHQLFSAASFVEEAFENNSKAILIGLAALTAVLAVLLYSPLAAIAAVGSVSLAVVVVLLIVSLSGSTLNTVVLSGIVLALAVMIDEIVTVVEGILRRMRALGEQARAPLISIVGDAVVESRRTVGYALVCMLLLAVPIYSMGGLAGALLTPLAGTYMLAVAVAVGVALTVTPVMTYMLLANRPAIRELPLACRLEAGYRNALGAVLDRPSAAFAGSILIVVGAVVMWPLVHRSLLPDFNDRDLVVRWAGTAGTSHPGMTRITGNAVNELRAIPGVRSVSAHIGRAVTGDQIVTMNSGQIWISIDEAADYAKTLEAVRATLADYPGIDQDVQSYLRERIREALTSVTTPVVVRIYGPDRQVLGEKAEEVRQLLSRVNGLVNLRIEGQVSEPQVHVKVNLAAAAQHGLKPGDVRRAAATLFSGLEVGKIFEQQKVFDVVVWSNDKTRNSITGLANMLVETPAGAHVRLGDLTDIQVMATPSVIRHERASPYIDVTAGVAGRDTGAVVHEIERRLADVRFPLEHHPEVIGEYGERRVAQIRVLAVAIGSAIGIFLLFQALLGSWQFSTVASAAVIGSAAGGMIAIVASGGAASIGSFVAFIGILAISVRQTSMLLQRTQDRMTTGEVLNRSLILEAAGERFLPTISAMLAVVAALLPAIMLGSVSGLEIGRPMAIVLLGGLVTATAMTLLVLPALMLRYGGSITSSVFKGASS